MEFDLRRQEFTKFSRSLDKDNVNKLVHKSYPIRNICFDPRKKQLLILHDDTSLIVINKEKVSKHVIIFIRKIIECCTLNFGVKISATIKKKSSL